MSEPERRERMETCTKCHGTIEGDVTYPVFGPYSNLPLCDLCWEKLHRGRLYRLRLFIDYQMSRFIFYTFTIWWHEIRKLIRRR